MAMARKDEGTTRGFWLVGGGDGVGTLRLWCCPSPRPRIGQNGTARHLVVWEDKKRMYFVEFFA